MRKFKLNKQKIILILTVLLAVLLAIAVGRSQPKNIMYESYEKLLEGGMIESATIDGGQIELTTKGGRKYLIVKDGVDVRKLMQKAPVDIKKDTPVLDEILAVLALLIICFAGLVVYARFKKQKIAAQNENQKANVYEYENIAASSVQPAISNVKFDDVAGIKDVKFELGEIVDFLKDPVKYKKFGIKMPKGVLMVGPPGVGKTLVAKAVAGEAGVPFFYQSGASFVQIYVGMGAKRVHELFLKAKAYAPSIIFID